MRFQNSFARTALRRSVAGQPRADLPATVRSRHSLSRKAFFSGVLLFFQVLFPSHSIQAATFDPSIYHTYSATQTWADNLASLYPNLVKVVKYGESSRLQNPLFAIEITSNVAVNDPNKSDFLFTAGIHAREVIGSESAIAIANNLVAGYNSADPATKSAYQNMLAQRDVWIIPQQNPDGRLQVEQGYSVQRKNWDYYAGQNLADYTRGVDLNRNFPHRWGQYAGDLSPASETYCGPRPLSESESSALWTFVHDTNYFSNLLCAVDFHSGAQTILTPWASKGDYDANEKNIPTAVQQKFDSLTAGMLQQNPARHAQNSLTPVITTNRLGYESYGTLSDSLYEEFSNSTRTTYAMTEELYTGSYIGGYPDYYYSYFNPVTAAGRDAAMQNAVDSALYLLSDAAFTVPEPSTFALLVIAAIALLASIRRRF